MARSLSRRDLTFVVIPMSACWLQAVLSTAKARTARIPLDFLRMKPPNLTHSTIGPNDLNPLRLHDPCPDRASQLLKYGYGADRSPQPSPAGTGRMRRGDERSPHPRPLPPGEGEGGRGGREKLSAFDYE